MNEPKLRFKADDGSEFPDWEEKKIGELGAFIKGAALSKSDISESGSPLILYGELYTTYKEVAYNIQRKTQAVVDKKYYSCVGDVIIPTSGESAEEISTATCVMVPDVILGGDLNIFRSDIVDGRIMSYILNHQAKWKIATIAQGKSIVHIQAKQLANICVKYPLSKVEQQKIAEFLSTIDTVIAKQKETVSAWEERKKGVMQKLFSQEVRFKADDGSEFPEWEEKKLKNILKEYKEYSAKDGSYEHVSLTKEGVVPKSERYERDFLVKDVDKKYRITHLGDICYNPANLKFGVICRNKYGDGIFSPIYVTFQVCKDMLPEFVEMLVTRQDFIQYALRYQQGTVYERMSVSPEDLLSIKVFIPCLAEQQKIADCLSALDDVIEKQKATLAAWEELKKGLLQQMFV